MTPALASRVAKTLEGVRAQPIAQLPSSLTYHEMRRLSSPADASRRAVGRRSLTSSGATLSEVWLCTYYARPTSSTFNECGITSPGAWLVRARERRKGGGPKQLFTKLKKAQEGPIRSHFVDSSVFTVILATGQRHRHR